MGCAGGCVGDERVEMIIPVRGYTCGKVCADSSGCLATQAAVMAQAGCWSSLRGGDVGWLRKQQQGLGLNALAERCSNGGTVENVRAVMVPVRPRETPSLGDSGNGASMRALEVVSTAYGTSGAGLASARGNGAVAQAVAEDSDAAEARARLRAAGVVEYDPLILSRRYGRQPLKVELSHWEYNLCLNWLKARRRIRVWNFVERMRHRVWRL